MHRIEESTTRHFWDFSAPPHSLGVPRSHSASPQRFGAFIVILRPRNRYPLAPHRYTPHFRSVTHGSLAFEKLSQKLGKIMSFL